MPAAPGHPVVLFDGVCNLCAASVRFVIHHDARGRHRFASLQSRAAVRLLLESGVTGPLPDTLVLVDDDGVHVRSTAVLRVARQLDLPWRLAGVFLLIPRPVRDAVYNAVAHHRYRWFGRQDECLVPAPHLQDRFLSD